MKNIEACTRGSRRSSTRMAAVAVIAALAFLAFGPAQGRAGGERVERRNGNRPPVVPESLEVPAGQELAFRATGVGVQIYVWTVNPTNAALSGWVFKAPHAVLFHKGEVVGIHFAGPAWESNDGSKVVGTRLAGATVDTNAIPWLLLQASSTSGVGVFANVTYIQRLHTTGGLAPSTPGNVAGEEVLVPYVADYVFYQIQ